MDENRNATKVSVIIPVYNASKTLHACLDSILNQTMAQFEVICIDDGSTDDSWEILRSFAAKDSRIRILNQENQGAGRTRNSGIQLATGDYVLFVDADDYVRPMTLETVYDIGVTNNADIVLYDGDKFDTVTGKRIPVRHFLRTGLLPKGLEVFSIQDCPDVIFQLTNPGPFAKAFKLDLLKRKNLCFSSLPNSEDLRFTFTAMAAAERITAATKKCYMYRVGQTTNVESRKEEAPLCFIEAYLELANWLKENGLFDLCRKSFGDRFCSSIVYTIGSIHSESARQAICQRLCAEDVAQLHVLDQSDGFYGNNRSVRQVRWLLENYRREPVIQPKVSIIIPVFNVEKYLAECLESLICQTMPDFEVLCIDDGSTDSSTEILALYSRLDSRIKVICGAHQGAAAARNQGIDFAVGEYLFFMDSDDKAADTLVEKAYAAAKKADVDVVVFDGYSLDDQSGKVGLPKHYFRKMLAPVDKAVFSVADVPNYIFQIAHAAPWTKLIRREFVLKKQLRYQNLPNSNDTYFIQMALALADRITMLDERLYFYRIGMTSNTQSKKDKAPDCIVDVYLATHQKLVEEGIWKLCEKSWVHEFLAVICFSLRTLSTRTAYQKLYRRLISPEVTATGYLQHGESFYEDVTSYVLVQKFLSSPIKFANAEERDTRTLIHAQCDAPIVSVIIPAYNVEDYLSECLENIQNQTLRDIEIICVDDGSTDSSLSILCKAAERDKRIQVLVQKNSGLSAARNAGIQVARGKYLYYIDADDMLEQSALQSLVEKAEENDLDCIFFGADTFYESDELYTEYRSFDNYYHYSASCKEPMSGPNLLALLKQTREYRASACMQFVKTALIHDNNIRFYDGIIHEDELYTLEMILYAQRCVAIPERFYRRRVRNNSTMTSAASIARLLGHLVCYTESLSLLNRFELTAPQYEAVYAFHDSMMHHIQMLYLELSVDERHWVYAFCTGAQRSIYRTLEKLLPQKQNQGGSTPGSTVYNRRLNDHDTALRYAQEELAQDRARLNDHDTALRHAQQELAQNQTRMNDHDTALGYLQQDVAAIQRSLLWKIDRILTWLPRKLKRFIRRGM